MTIFQQYVLIFLIYTFLKVINSEILPFFIYADQIILKCSDGKFEVFNSTTNIHSTCVQNTQIERFNLFQLYIQCPDGRLFLEYNRTFTFNAQISEYSMTNLQPHCFINSTSQHSISNHLVPYQTRYASGNGTLTQIISFQCSHNLTTLTKENWKLNEDYYLFFKLMNYALCRYLIQFKHSNGKCDRLHQQMYKIQAQIKHSICYYQLGMHPTDIPLDYFDHLLDSNHSANKSVYYSTKSIHHKTIITLTISITAIALFLCLIIFIVMYQLGLFRH